MENRVTCALYVILSFCLLAPVAALPSVRTDIGILNAANSVIGDRIGDQITDSAASTGEARSKANLSQNLQVSQSDRAPAPPSDSSSSTSVGLIVGGSIGGLLVLVMIGAVAWYWQRPAWRTGKTLGLLPNKRGTMSDKHVTTRSNSPPKNLVVANQ